MGYFRVRKRLVLNFSGHNSPELASTLFEHPIVNSEKFSIRSSYGAASDQIGAFQWSKAVRAICVLFLKHKLICASENSRALAFIEGHRHSLAASLDYALDKQPNWIHAMFGTGSGGQSILRRCLCRINGGRKRQGPVTIYLNGRFLNKFEVKIIWNSIEVTNPEPIMHLLSRVSAIDSPISNALDQNALSILSCLN